MTIFLMKIILRPALNRIFLCKKADFQSKRRFLIKKMTVFLPRKVIFAQKTLFTKNRLTTNYLTDKSVNGQFVGINFFLWLFDG